MNQQATNEVGSQMVAVASTTRMIRLPPFVEIRQRKAIDPVAPITDADAVANLVGQSIMAEPRTDVRKQTLTEAENVPSLDHGVRGRNIPSSGNRAWTGGGTRPIINKKVNNE